MSSKAENEQKETPTPEPPPPPAPPSGGSGCFGCGTTSGGCVDLNRHGLML
ncbi:hypothetical protein [Streptomyces sp. NPDC056061]|uniref:hypothetical protein n=1 Tax=Streptomyces sp. NPDC056061 TaxID=3345700 RepID=UPI0035DF0FF4